MSDSPQIFRCSQCGAGYKWDPRLVGRAVKCRCGQDLLVPAASPDPTQDYDIADTAASPAPRTRPAPRIAATYIPPRTREPILEDEAGSGPIRSYILPAIFLTLGILIAFSQITWKRPDPPRANTIYVGQMLVANLLAIMIMFLSAWLCSHLLEMNLGRPAIAAFKLSAICLFAIASGIALKRFDPDPYGVYGISTGFCAATLIYWSGLGLLFKLEIHEVFLTASAVTLLQIIAAWAIFG